MTSTECVQTSLASTVKHEPDEKNIMRHPLDRHHTLIPSFQLFTLEPNHIIRQACHPQAFLNHTLHRLKSILGAGVDEAEKAFDNGRGGPVPFEVDKRFSVTAGGNLRGLLGVVG